MAKENLWDQGNSIEECRQKVPVLMVCHGAETKNGNLTRECLANKKSVIDGLQPLLRESKEKDMAAMLVEL